MANKPTRKRNVDFNAEGVSFIFPASLSHVGVIKLKPTRPRGRGKFKPKRHIISVLLFDERTKEEMTDFGASGFDLRVEFQASDLAPQHPNQMKALAKLDLGYYDARKCNLRWVSCKTQHGYVVQPELYPAVKNGRWLGFAVVNIKKWSDPEMAWGP